MLFLILQMAFLLVIALSIGLILGWWLNKLKTKQAIEQANPTLEATQGQHFALKSQLDKCFDEKTALHLELKSVKDCLSKGKKSQVTDEKEENNSELELELQEKINVLMEDLQLRDDIISSLRKEIAQLKKNKGIG